MRTIKNVLCMLGILAAAAYADLDDFANPGASLSLADLSLVGENASDGSGYSVSSAGDVNGDGYDDVLIGAYGNSDGGSLAGKTYLVYGSSTLSGTLDLSAADASFIGENAADYSGLSVSSAGDVNGDGYDDILIGASGNDDGGNLAGKTYLIYGSSTLSGTLDLSAADASFIGENADDVSGYSISSAGDVNGDGYDDILIGAYGSGAGKSYLIYGSSTLLGTLDLSAADASFIGENAYDSSGWSVSGAGDVNGDGYDDVLIGATSNDDGGSGAGKSYLIYGSSTLLGTLDLSAADASFIGENVSDGSGWPVSDAGDVNGDGYDDILVGAYGNSDGGSFAGKSYLIYGSSTLLGTLDLSAADASFIGENVSDYSGRSASNAGDIDGDGLSDILIGAYGNDDGGISAGKAYLIYSDNECQPEDAIYVDAYLGTSSGPGGSDCPYDTIQGGIDAADAAGLSRVIVRGGIYEEVVTLSEDIELVGELRWGFWAPFIVGDGSTPYIVEGADGASFKFFIVCKGGIELDGVNGMTVQENVIYDGVVDSRPIYFGTASDDNMIQNNIIYHEVTTVNQAILVGFNCSGNFFLNNTVHSIDRTTTDANGTVGIYLVDFSTDNEFRNNILWGRTVTGSLCGFLAAGTHVTTTIEYNSTPATNSGIFVNRVTNITANRFPEFTNPVPLGFDYTLQSTSVCINAGDSSAAYNDPDGSRNDMGAFGGTNYLDFRE